MPSPFSQAALCLTASDYGLKKATTDVDDHPHLFHG